MTTKIGKLRYDPKSILGQGYGTTVFSGFFKRSLLGSDNPVAIKRVQKSDLSLKEVEIMKRTTDDPNPYILRFIHMEMTNDFLYLATELCRGTLCEYVNNRYEGPKFEDEGEILLQVTKGLAYLHQLKIVHRDIKPSNILIFVPPTPLEGESDAAAESIKPQIKLADFSISKALHVDKKDFTNTSATNPNGTRGWMAPEVFQLKRPDSKVDIFPLGCIFAYTLSGGKHPFGDDPDKRSVRIKEKQPMVMVQQDLIESYSGDGASAFELIESMLEMDPYKRPTVEKVLDSEFFLVFPVEGQTQKLSDICLSLKKNNTIDDCNVAYQKLKYLLQHGKVDPNVYKYNNPYEWAYGMTPLILLCKFYQNNNLIDLVKLLIKYGAGVNGDSYFIGRWIRRPLHELCQYYKNDNLIDIVKLLIQNGAYVKAKDNVERTPLHYLCANYKYDNLVDLVKLLKQNGADVNAKDRYGNTPLHFSCRSYNTDNLIAIAKLLLQNGANVNTKDYSGWTPLFSLCLNYENDDLIDLVKLLIQNGADINAKSTILHLGYDWTPLHILCKYHKNNELIVDIVKIMIENGANINSVATTDEGEKKTPLEILRDRGISL